MFWGVGVVCVLAVGVACVFQGGWRVFWRGGVVCNEKLNRDVLFYAVCDEITFC